jgi:hypothetical protein
MQMHGNACISIYFPFFGNSIQLCISKKVNTLRFPTDFLIRPGNTCGNACVFPTLEMFVHFRCISSVRMHFPYFHCISNALEIQWKSIGNTHTFPMRVHFLAYFPRPGNPLEIPLVNLQIECMYGLTLFLDQRKTKQQR